MRKSAQALRGSGQAGMPVLLRGWAADFVRASAKVLMREAGGEPGHRPIRVCPAQNCEKLREVATRGRSGVQRCDGRIFPGDGRCDGRGWRGFCERRGPSLRGVRGRRGGDSGCRAEGRRLAGRRSRWGRTARRSAPRFSRGRPAPRAMAAMESRMSCLSGCGRKGRDLGYLLRVVYHFTILHAGGGVARKWRGRTRDRSLRRDDALRISVRGSVRIL
jgi:hypothetical protein